MQRNREENTSNARSEVTSAVAERAATFLCEHLFWWLPETALLRLQYQLRAVISSAVEHALDQQAGGRGGPAAPFVPSLN